VKLAKYYDLGPDDVVLTVATDGAECTPAKRAKAIVRYFEQVVDARRGEATGPGFARADRVEAVAK